MQHGDRVQYRYLDPRGLSTRQLESMCIEYFDQEALEYDELDNRIDRRRRYLTAVDKYAAKLLHSLPTCERIVSFGCGTGRREVDISDSLVRRPTIFGVDKSSQMRKICRQRGVETFDTMDALEHLSGQVDAILCLYSFPHLPDVDARLRTLRRFCELLRPGGVLMIDVFNLHDKFEWNSKLLDGGTGLPPATTGPLRGDVLYGRIGRSSTSYMHYFTAGEIAGQIEESGLIIREIIGVGHGRNPGELGVPLDEGCLLVTAQRAARADSG